MTSHDAGEIDPSDEAVDKVLVKLFACSFTFTCSLNAIKVTNKGEGTNTVFLLKCWQSSWAVSSSYSIVVCFFLFVPLPLKSALWGEDN